jgi:DnaJ-class molecular chaperone
VSALHPCPECLGDGYFIRLEGPGREAGYGYEPFERREDCERCEGAGEIEAPTCPGCSGPMDDRGEYAGDPYCPSCKYHVSEFFEEAAA